MGKVKRWTVKDTPNTDVCWLLHSDFPTASYLGAFTREEVADLLNYMDELKAEANKWQAMANHESKTVIQQKHQIAALEAERDRLEKVVGSTICKPVIEVRDMADNEKGELVDDVVFVNGQILDELDGDKLADQLRRALGSFQPQPMTDAEVKVAALEAERDALLVRAKAYERLIDSTGYDVRVLTGYEPLGGGDE